MASCKSVLLFIVTTVISFSDFAEPKNAVGGSISFPLNLAAVESSFRSYPGSNQKNAAAAPSPASSSYSFNSPVRKSIVPIVTIPFGTPPQPQSMVLDTGSQLSWVQCRLYNQTKQNATAAFITSNSSSYYPFICNHTWDTRCPTHDFSLGPICNNSRCQYSFFYGDGTSVSGNFVRENVTLSENKTAKVTIGCSVDKDSTGAQGLLGMNLANLSFVSQLKVSKFSYCVPTKINSNGGFYLGENPNYNEQQLKYTNFTKIDNPRLKPNSLPDAYTVTLLAIYVNNTKLNIDPTVFQMDAGGSGQTIIDSGTQYTYLFDSAHDVMKEKVVNLTSSSYNITSNETFEMCFKCKPYKVAEKIGELMFEFGNGVNVTIPKETMMVYYDEVGLSCIGIAKTSSSSGAGSTFGSMLLSGRWVETNVEDMVVGFGEFGGCGV